MSYEDKYINSFWKVRTQYVMSIYILQGSFVWEQLIQQLELQSLYHLYGIATQQTKFERETKMCQLGRQRSFNQYFWFSFLLWLRIICMLLFVLFPNSNSVCFRNTWLSFLLMYFKGSVFCSLCTLFSFIRFHLIGFSW